MAQASTGSASQVEPTPNQLRSLQNTGVLYTRDMKPIPVIDTIFEIEEGEIQSITEPPKGRLVDPMPVTLEVDESKLQPTTTPTPGPLARPVLKPKLGVSKKYYRWQRHRPRDKQKTPVGSRVSSWLEAANQPHVIWHHRLLPGADARPLAVVLNEANANKPGTAELQHVRNVLTDIYESSMLMWLQTDFVGGNSNSIQDKQCVLSGLLRTPQAFGDVPFGVALSAQPLCLTYATADIIFNAIDVARGALVFDRLNAFGSLQGVRGCPRVDVVMHELGMLAERNLSVFYEQLGWMAHACVLDGPVRGMLVRLSWLYLLLELDFGDESDPRCLETASAIADAWQRNRMTPQDCATRVVMLIRLCSALQGTPNEIHWQRNRQDLPLSCSSLAAQVSAWHRFTASASTDGPRK